MQPRTSALYPFHRVWYVFLTRQYQCEVGEVALFLFINKTCHFPIQLALLLNVLLKLVMVLCLTSEVVLPKIWIWLIDWGKHYQLSPLQPSWTNVASDAFAENSFSDRKIAVMTMLACMMKQLIGRDPMPPSRSGTLRTKFSPPTALMNNNVMKCRAIDSRQADGHILVWIAGIRHSIPNPKHTSGRLDLYCQN